MCGGQSPILGILGLDPVLEGAVARNVAFFAAFETLLIKGTNWFDMAAPVPSVGGLSGPRKS